MRVLTVAEQSAASGQTTLWVLGGLVVAGYVVSLMWHPWTHCRRCEGSPRSYGTVYTTAFRLCSSCGGSGRQLRLGARLLGIGDQ